MLAQWLRCSRLAQCAMRLFSVSPCRHLSSSLFKLIQPHTDGWPSVFYLYGGLGVVWYVCWYFLAFNSPSRFAFMSNKLVLVLLIIALQTSSHQSHRARLHHQRDSDHSILIQRKCIVYLLYEFGFQLFLQSFIQPASTSRQSLLDITRVSMYTFFTFNATISLVALIDCCDAVVQHLHFSTCVGAVCNGFCAKLRFLHVTH
jgi:hypothetical protein